MVKNLSKIKIKWDWGTGYDLFISLTVLHNPDYFNVRSSWASGMRQRLPQKEREVLAKFMDVIAYTPPIGWINRLPGEKTGKNIISSYLALSPIDQVGAFVEFTAEFRDKMTDIIKRESWDNDDLKSLGKYYEKHAGITRTKKQLSKFLNALADGQSLVKGVPKALQVYYEMFFEEEQQRIHPYLEVGLKETQAVAKKLDLLALLTELSEGIRFTEEMFSSTKTLTFIPSFWLTPRIIRDFVRDGVYVFGIRPDNVSLIPGEVIPSHLLNVLEALSNPTRLKILRYVNGNELTATQIASRLRLRPPTVAHHLKTLRLTGLVYVASKPNQKEVYYKTRKEHIDSLSKHISSFVSLDE